jgi:Trk K+ transport system NAD-binding subunit
MATETLIIVVGGDYLAFEICREILKTAGHRVVLVWHHEDERAERKLDHEAKLLGEEFGDAFLFHNHDATEPGVLERAGLRPHGSGQSFCLVAVSQDDRLNLRIALAARDVNEEVQITLRQFNPLLGQKIQEGLRYKCTAISPAAHAAATYAANAVDPACSYALPFPTLETMIAGIARRKAHDPSFEHHSMHLFGFSERLAADYGVVGCTVGDAEAKIGARIVGVNGDVPYLCHGDESHPDEGLLGRSLTAEDRIVAFGPAPALRDAWPGASKRAGKAGGERPSALWRDLKNSLRRVEPILRTVFVGSIVAYFSFVVYFAFAMHLSVPSAMYYVTTTMTTVGYGDITPCHNCADKTNLGIDLPLFFAMLAMLVGVTIFAVFTATVTSALNSEQTRRLQGLRRIHRSGHVIVCGAGNVGSLVIDYLRDMGEQVVVVERNPDALLIELARDRKIDLLTGDATNDETIAFCTPERARSLVGVTNSDTANLEAALGARSRVRARGAADLNVVLRIDDLAFGASIQRHFGINSFSTTELTAPTIAGLARFESTRGRFDVFVGQPYERRYQLAERVQGVVNSPPPAPPERPGYKVRWIPLYVWRENAVGKGSAHPIHNFESDVRTGDRLLFMVPLDQFVQ